MQLVTLFRPKPRDWLAPAGGAGGGGGGARRKDTHLGDSHSQNQSFCQKPTQTSIFVRDSHVKKLKNPPTDLSSDLIFLDKRKLFFWGSSGLYQM